MLIIMYCWSVHVNFRGIDDWIDVAIDEIKKTTKMMRWRDRCEDDGEDRDRVRAEPLSLTSTLGSTHAMFFELRQAIIHRGLYICLYMLEFRLHVFFLRLLFIRFLDFQNPMF
jgi:hypothetical protein